jgi:hypothetical protein
MLFSSKGYNICKDFGDLVILGDKSLSSKTKLVGKLIVVEMVNKFVIYWC